MSNTHLIIIIIAISFSFLSWLFGKIREQAEINRVQRERVRRREEELRTGRPHPEPQQSGVRLPAELQSLAERRQQQLRALREQQMQRMRGQRAGDQPPQTQQKAQPGSKPPQSPTGVGWEVRQPSSLGRSQMSTPTPMREITLQSSHPPVKHQTASAGRESMRTPTPMRGQQPTPPASRTPPPQRQRQPQRPTQRQTQSPATRPPARAPQAPARPQSPYEGPPRERQLGSLVRKQSTAATPLDSSTAAELRGMTRDDWRRAIILREILDPPVSERGPASEPGIQQ